MKMKKRNKCKVQKNWEVISKYVSMLLEEPNLTNQPDCDTLQKDIRRIIWNWGIWQKKWSVASSEHLIEKVSEVLGGTCRKSYPAEAMNNMIELYGDCVKQLWDTLVDFSSLLAKETISTSSTIVHSLTTNADATSPSHPTLEQLTELASDSANSSSTWTSSTGSMFSYTSLCQNGYSDLRYGLLS